ncbi:hypothetical protein GMRT_15492 [Giardia muris]|uniref:Uncharacterized protein n=1 Tax=Giardia muris TaxID=5742 RepID=A0A4Z1T9I9_GIAMU|nr:hypothetical protein GMRT_15492 [Giardia muris]|eukprot:TNJ29817.1 hypothetical protein GMRT_15492 [Giardia muris]
MASTYPQELDLTPYERFIPLLNHPAHYGSVDALTPEGFRFRQQRFTKLLDEQEALAYGRSVQGRLGVGSALLDAQDIAAISGLQKEAMDAMVDFSRTRLLESHASMPPEVPAGWVGPPRDPAKVCQTSGLVKSKADSQRRVVETIQLADPPFGPIEPVLEEELELEVPSFRPTPASLMELHLDRLQRFKNAVNTVVIRNRATYALGKIQEAYGRSLPLYQRRLFNERRRPDVNNYAVKLAAELVAPEADSGRIDAYRVYQDFLRTFCPEAVTQEVTIAQSSSVAFVPFSICTREPALVYADEQKTCYEKCLPELPVYQFVAPDNCLDTLRVDREQVVGRQQSLLQQFF